MEPASLPVTKGRGSIEDPEVLENVPGHVIPILEREFDDFDTEAGEVPARRDAGDRVHRLPPQAGRLRPAPARRADDPREAADGRHHARAAGGLRRRHRAVRAARTRATSRRARTSRSTTCRCDDAAEADPRALRRRPVEPRGLRQHGAQRHRRPVGRRLRATSSSTSTPYAGAYVRYFVRHPTTQLMPRKVKTAFDALADADRALTGIHDIAFIAARARRRQRGFEVRVGGGTSIMPRVAPTLVRLRRRRRRRVPQGAPRPSSASSTARTGCASTAPAPASRCSSTRSASTRCASSSTRSCQGDWVDERDFDVEPACACDDEEAARARRRRAPTPRPTATAREFERFRAVERRAPSARRASRPSRSRSPRGDLTPEQLRGLAGRSCATYSRRLRAHDRAPEPAAALGARRGGLRGLAARCASSASATPGADQVSDVVSLPRHRLAASSASPSSMGLNAAVRERVDDDGDHRPADAQASTSR